MNLAQQILSPIADKVPTLVFLGPPGVGKGTYSSRIARQLGLAHISVGDLIRMEIKAGSGSGNAVGSLRLLLAFPKTLNYDSERGVVLKQYII